MEKKIFLLADDDLDDREIFCEALNEIDPAIICHEVDNGQDALDKLALLDELPQIIFLDINMHIMNGWQCLKRLKEDERYQHIPIIITSTSSHKQEMEAALSLGALCFFTKPSSYHELKEVLQTIIINLGSNLEHALKQLEANGCKYVYAGEEDPTTIN